MIHVYNNPYLLDFIRVCMRMPQDERDNFEALTGEKFNVDSVALGNYTVQGPKWVIKDDEEPICIGGFVPQRPGVYRDFMINTPESFEKHWFTVTRFARRAMDGMLRGGAHRLECISHHSRAKAFRWYDVLGYNKEATLYGYCANGADAVLFSRVKH